MKLPRVSRKEFIILELLIRHGEMFGLQLVQHAPDEFTRSTIYITLQRMTEKGFLTSRVVEDRNGGPARRLYHATGLGYRMYSAIRQEIGAGAGARARVTAGE